VKRDGRGREQSDRTQTLKIIREKRRGEREKGIGKGKGEMREGVGEREQRREAEKNTEAG
jgi:hypothetical protein